MPKLVVHGAMLSCNQGLAPAALAVLPANQADAAARPVATVQDFKPNLNIPPFGMCRTQANPQVASATAAAQGVLTPMPCIPVTTSPWSPGSREVTVNGVQALTADSKCSCQWTGSIEVTEPGSEVDVE
jgi:hypothetical protein